MSGSKRNSISDLGLKVESMLYHDLLARREEINNRLDIIGIELESSRSKKKGTGAHKELSSAAVSAVAEKPDNSDTPTLPLVGGSKATLTGLGLAQDGPLTPSPSLGAVAVLSSTTTTPPSAQAVSPTLATSLVSLFPPISFVKKSDTHWDFVLKELLWLSADFQLERKRQVSTGKKISQAIRQFHKTTESRRIRELAEAELKKRRIASKMGRDVKAWWIKIERVIAYKQKLDADREKKKAMDRHLVFLVRQTEKYGESLMLSGDRDEEELKGLKELEGNGNGLKNKNVDHEESDASGSTAEHLNSQSSRQRPRHRGDLTIEEAMSQAALNSRRTRRNRLKDYSRVNLDDSYELYGELAKEDDTNSYSPDTESEEDDETTLMEEEENVRLERLRTNQLSRADAGNVGTEQSLAYGNSSSNGLLVGGDVSTGLYDEGTDPNEIYKLLEESEMSIEEVLNRFLLEAKANEEGRSTLSACAATEATATSAERRDKAESTTGSSGMSFDVDSKKKVSFAINDTDNLVDPNVVFASEIVSRDLDNDASLGNDESLLPLDLSLESGSEISAQATRTPMSDDAQSSANEGSKTTSSDDESDADDDSDVNDIEGYARKEFSNTSSERSQVFASKAGNMLDLNTKVDRDEDFGQEMNLVTNISEQKYVSVENSTHAEITELDEHESFLSEPEAFEVNESEDEDETTSDVRENLGRAMPKAAKINMLRQVNELTSEQLLSIHGRLGAEKPASSHDSEDSELSSASVEHAQMLLDDDDSAKVDEFYPDAEGGVDDETTISAEERRGRDMSYEDEIELLKRESEMSIEELKAMYSVASESACSSSDTSQSLDTDTQDNTSTPSTSFLTLSSVFEADNNAGDDEFQPDVVEDMDDETTLEVEEQLGREMSYDEELSMLKRESEISVDDLRAMYLKTEKESTDTDQRNGEGLSKAQENKALQKRSACFKSYGEERDCRSTKKQKSLEKVDIGEIDGSDAFRSLEEFDAKARQTTVTRPYLLSNSVKLREYQQIGLNWLVSTQTRRLNGILADEMGLGKTLQTISLLSYLACYKGIWGPHLVIVPTSCIVNWEMECKRFCPALKVMTYYGSAKRRKELRQGWTKTNWHHVIITSYQLAVQDSFAFRRKRWYYLILDEAQNIKNFQSQRWQKLVSFNTQRRLLLTGTPLQNNLMELWSLLHFLMPYVFRSRKEFSYWFSNPINNIIEGNTNRNDDLLSRLHGIIRPFVLRRLKKDVETQMPGKYEHIVKTQLSRRQMFLYEEFMARSSTRMALQKGGNFMSMMNVLMQLRKVCNHPDLFEPRSVITPFFMNPLLLVTAGCVTNIWNESPFCCVSTSLLHPLWSLACGVPSYDDTILHDCIKDDQLRRLKSPPNVFLDSIVDDKVPEPHPSMTRNPRLAKFLSRIWNDAKLERANRVQLLESTNTWRCTSSTFPYSQRTINAVTVDVLFSDTEKLGPPDAVTIASTPKELLEMRKTQQLLADDVDDLVKKFVFCVPKAGTRSPAIHSSHINSSETAEKRLCHTVLESFESYFRPFRSANARLTAFFPDKKLVQFDAGKLQALAELLRNLKQGRHRALIFTQMSKMLDILEAFLNLNGHTYLRLDGSTGVDQRQRLMDRFNNDTKVFCFILSTRSGGLGVNLTGADTVVFYDSDWNPSMDAQAQDRAHRIGQTRDVHIYRLVTEHTIEENILVKARQKRHLDFLVMDAGQFHTSHPPIRETHNETQVGDISVDQSDVYTNGGLRSILGFEDCEINPVSTKYRLESSEESNHNPAMSQEQMENAMASLEDEDDVIAMRGAQKEAAEELQEFDENIQLNKEEDGDGGENQDSQDENEDGTSNENKNTVENTAAYFDLSSTKIDEQEIGDGTDEKLEQEFAAWQSKVGVDKDSIDASLTKAERYGLRFKEKHDPFYSLHFWAEQQRYQSASNEHEEFDVDAIEIEKVVEERQAMDDGDLLATRPMPEMLPRQRQLYLREKARLRADKKRRKLTGQNWGTKIDGRTNLPFWYNVDTGESIWDKPELLIELEAEKNAHEKRWNAIPFKPLVCIMGFLRPCPERMLCAKVCRQWHSAASHISFVRHVFPVEMGALVMDAHKMEHNHYRTIAEALAISLPGDTIELGDGHYWVNDPGLIVDIPLRIVGDEKDPSHVVIELSGTVAWRGCNGWIEGVTFRRPKISSESNQWQEILLIENGGRLDMVACVLENEERFGNAARVRGKKSRGRWKGVNIIGGGSQGSALLVEDGGLVHLSECNLSNSLGSGVVCLDGSIVELEACEIKDNGGSDIAAFGTGRAVSEDSKVLDNRCGDFRNK